MAETINGVIVPSVVTEEQVRIFSETLALPAWLLLRNKGIPEASWAYPYRDGTRETIVVAPEPDRLEIDYCWWGGRVDIQSPKLSVKAAGEVARRMRVKGVMDIEGWTMEAYHQTEVTLGLGGKVVELSNQIGFAVDNASGAEVANIPLLCASDMECAWCTYNEGLKEVQLDVMEPFAQDWKESPFGLGEMNVGLMIEALLAQAAIGQTNIQEYVGRMQATAPF